MVGMLRPCVSRQRFEIVENGLSVLDRRDDREDYGVQGFQKATVLQDRLGTP